MKGCGGCANRGKAIDRLLQKRENVSVTKTVGYIAKSGARDLTRLAQSSLAKIRRR